jgi:hypothetical protein
VALLNAEEEVGLATQIEVGLYVAERVRRPENITENLSPQLRRRPPSQAALIMIKAYSATHSDVAVAWVARGISTGGLDLLIRVRR